MKIGRELAQQRDVSSLAFLGKGFEVDHQSLVVIRSEEQADFAAETGAGLRVVEEIADSRNEIGAVEVLHNREDLNRGVFGLEKWHHLVVDGMETVTADDVKHFVGFGIDSLEAAVGREDLQPDREQQIDLASILPQR